MRLVSTRNPKVRSTFLEALAAGPAPDGGLWMPEPIACFRDVPHLLALPWAERNTEILYRLLGEEVDRADLEALAAEAFDFPVPLVPLKDRLFVLELFHGPSLAFKDFGARFLARMLAHRTAREGLKLRTVLVATSGDTGAAVAQAFWKVKGVRAVVLYPKGRVSPLQEAQFATLGGNVLAYAVEGSFDDCQRLAKAAFADPAVAGPLALVSANSINIARLLAQVLYYFEAAAQLRALGLREAPLFSVPSGNFGNLCAGYLARAMGLPVKAFVAACNANRTVPDHLDTGVYTPRPSLATLSNAMDVGDPSNWPRILHLFQGNLDELRATLRWGSLDDAATRRALWELNGLGCTADPHTAVAYGVLEERRGLGEPAVVLATAHPAKFADLLKRDMNLDLALPPGLAEAQTLPLQAQPLEAREEALKDVLMG